MNGNEFAALAVMLYFAVLLFDGVRLIRSMVWLVFWFTLTASREWYVDIPLAVACFTATEWFFVGCSRSLGVGRN